MRAIYVAIFVIAVMILAFASGLRPVTIQIANGAGNNSNEYVNPPTALPTVGEFLISPSPSQSLPELIAKEYVTPSPSLARMGNEQVTGNQMVNQQSSLSPSPTSPSVVAKNTSIAEDTSSSSFDTTILATISALGAGIVIALGIMFRRRR